jgi:hypothetical protein
MFENEMRQLLDEGRGIAAGFLKGYADNRPAPPEDQSAIGHAITAGYNTRALYRPGPGIVRLAVD